MTAGDGLSTLPASEPSVTSRSVTCCPATSHSATCRPFTSRSVTCCSVTCRPATIRNCFLIVK